MKASVARFCGLSETYHKYRPHYPAHIVETLIEEAGLTKNSVIADIGSGTGLSCLPFLDNGNLVYGIEPNPEMRKIAGESLKNYPNFLQLPGTAENPGLPSSSIDFIFAGQALHWFDLQKCKKPLKEVAKKGGWFVIVWQERNVSTDFMEELEQMINEYSIDYNKVDHKNIDTKKLKSFFHPHSFEEKVFPYEQEFDLEGLKGRLLSCSYLPFNADKPGYDQMIKKIEEIFEKHKQDGKVTIPYHCKMYYGKFN